MRARATWPGLPAHETPRTPNRAQAPYSEEPGRDRRAICGIRHGRGGSILDGSAEGWLAFTAAMSPELALRTWAHRPKGSRTGSAYSWGQRQPGSSRSARDGIAPRPCRGSPLGRDLRCLPGVARRLNHPVIFQYAPLATLPTLNRHRLMFHPRTHTGQGTALPLGMDQLPGTQSANQDSAIIRRMKERRIDNP